MEPTITQLINLGSAGAVIIVVGLFLRFISAERSLDRAMWGSHLTDSVRILQTLSEQMKLLIETNTNTALMQKMRDELTAAVLKSRDTLTADTLVRKDSLSKGERPSVDKGEQ